MNHPQNPKGHPSKFIKKRLAREQVRLLEASFDATKKLEPERKFQLAREIGVSPRQIAIWYQNKRARWRSQSLELDYGSVQVQLEAALADRDQLEREVDSLRRELGRAQEMLFGFGHAQDQAETDQLLAWAGQQQPALSSSCDDGAASSSLNDDVGCSANWGNGEAMQYEDLYACFLVNSAKGTNP